MAAPHLLIGDPRLSSPHRGRQDMVHKPQTSVVHFTQTSYARCGRLGSARKDRLVPSPSLLILDIQRPDADGTTILETIRATAD